MLWTLAGPAPVATLVTVVTAFFDRAVVTTRDELDSVRYGVPFDWLVQDHRWMSPPFPKELQLSPGLPQENPTSVELLPFLADFLIVYAIVLAAVLLARLGINRLHNH